MATFLLFGTEKCIECHQSLHLCEEVGQRQTNAQQVIVFGHIGM